MTEPDSDDCTAFLAHLRRHGDKIYNFAHRLTGNEPDARALVQEALARAWAHRRRFDPGRPFDFWVNSILHNVYLDEVRRYERKHVVSFDAPRPDGDAGWTDALPGRDPDPLAALLKRDDGDRVQRALDALPAPYRAAVILCDIENLSYEEIAQALDCPVGTVRSRIHQGRLLLRRAFDASGKGA